jgi:hypothetical protein
METRAYHSDEPSETDEDAANEERRLGIYNIHEKETDRHNHVIKVVNKNWRSTRVTISALNVSSKFLR